MPAVVTVPPVRHVVPIHRFEHLFPELNHLSVGCMASHLRVQDVARLGPGDRGFDRYVYCLRMRRDRFYGSTCCVLFPVVVARTPLSFRAAEHRFGPVEMTLKLGDTGIGITQRREDAKR